MDVRYEDNFSAHRITDLVYQGPSPDEEAILICAKKNGYEYVGKNGDKLEFTILDKKVTLTLLNLLEFSPDRRRSSAIVRLPDGNIKLYSKGSDEVIFKLLSEDSRNSDLKTETEEQIQAFSIDVCSVDPYLIFQRDFVHSFSQRGT